MPTKLQQITWHQLADYLSVVALARPRLDARYGEADTVMSLFEAQEAGRPSPPGLTSCDWSFLNALYRSENRRSARSQQQSIRREMVKGMPNGRD